MPGEHVRDLPKMTTRQFQAFYHARPEPEKWELIDGIANRSPLPSLVHQRISRNIGNQINDLLQRDRPKWHADRKIGVLLSDNDKYNPEPDITVIDSAISIGQVYAGQFYFVVEVLSGSDRWAFLSSKLEFYSSHESCQGVLFVRQDRIEVELYSRAAGFEKQTIIDKDAIIDVPGLGKIGPLKQFYRSTPLFAG